MKECLNKGFLECGYLANFCYTDNDGVELTKPKKQGEKMKLEADLWKKKYLILRKIYNFYSDSWEARTTPTIESFKFTAQVRTSVSLTAA